MIFNISSSDTPLTSFEYDGERFNITRNFGLSNSFSISTTRMQGPFGSEWDGCPEGAVEVTEFVGLITWISRHNEFAFNIDPRYFLPFSIIIPHARVATQEFLKQMAS